MANYLPLPDGTFYPVEEGKSPQEAWQAAMQKYPEAFASKEPTAQPQEGFTAALKSGYSGLKGDIAALAGRTGLMGLPEAEKYIAEQEKYQKETYKPTEKGWTEAPLTKIGELAGGSLPYMVAPALAFAAAPAAGALGAGAGLATAAGLGASGLASATQFTGAGLTRQMKPGEGMAEKSLGETDLTNAALASIPQALLDVASLRMMPGIGKMFEKAGVNLSQKAAQDLAKEGIKKTAADYLLATGKTMGREGLTEAGQAVFERMQAGLDIDNPAARAEYFENFIGGAALGGILAPAGRYVERGAEQTRFGKEEQGRQAVASAEAQQAQAAAGVQAEEAKLDPEYATQVEAQYAALRQQYDVLKAAATAKVADNDLAGKARQAEAKQAFKDFTSADETSRIIQEYNLIQTAKPPGVAPAAEVPAAPTTEPTATASADDLQQHMEFLNRQLDDLRTAHQGITDTQQLIAAGKSEVALKTQLSAAQEALDALPPKVAEPTEKSFNDRMKRIDTAMMKAQSQGDMELMGKQAQKLEDLRAEYDAYMAGQAPAVGELAQRQTDIAAQQGGPALPTGDHPNVSSYLEDLDTLDKLRNQGFSETELAQLAEEFDKRRRAMGQGELFNTTNTRATNAARSKSRTELIADRDIAKATGNKKAEAEAVDGLRSLKEKSYGLTQDEVRALIAQGKTQTEINTIAKQKAAEAPAPNRVLEEYSGMEQPDYIKGQQHASDARAKAYGEMVSILNRFNMGKAKQSELDSARSQVVDNLINDINAVRYGLMMGRLRAAEETLRTSQATGTAKQTQIDRVNKLRQLQADPMDDSQERQVRRDAETQLRDLITRFGDTRSLVQVGGNKDPYFYPAQKDTGEFTRTGQPGFTVESRAPGKQTFGSPFAAAHAVKEGLDMLREDAIDLPPHKTPFGIYKANADRLIQELPEKLSPENEAIVQKIQANKRALMSDHGDAQDVISWLHGTRTGVDTTDLTNTLKERLAVVEKLSEQGRRSETETTSTGEIKRAVQEDMFEDEELKGKSFNTSAEFDAYLAGDALHELRSSIGPVAPTLSNLIKRLQPLQRRADALAQAVETIVAKHDAARVESESFTQEVTAEIQARQLAAERAHTDAIVRFNIAKSKLDEELAPLQMEYMSAQLKLKEAVEYSKDISETISQNTEKFQGYQQGVQEAIANVIAAKQKLSDAMGNDVSKADWDGMRSAQKEVVATSAKLEELRGKLPEALNNFLKKDRFFQAKLANELATVTELNADFDAAKKTLNRVASNQQKRKGTKEAIAGIAEAKEGITAAVKAGRVDTGVLEEIKTEQSAAKLAMEQKAGRAERLKKVTEGRIKAAKEGLLKQTKRRTQVAPEETQRDREEADRAKRKDENERAERLAAEFPGESVTFKSYRKAVSTLDSVGPRRAALEAKAADEKETKTTRDSAKRDLKALNLAEKFLNASTEGSGAIRLEAEETLAKLKQITIPHHEALVADNPTKSRKAELAKAKRLAKQTEQVVRSFKNRAERTPIETTSSQLADRIDRATEAMNKARGEGELKRADALQTQIDAMQASTFAQKEGRSKRYLAAQTDMRTTGVVTSQMEALLEVINDPTESKFNIAEAQKQYDMLLTKRMPKRKIGPLVNKVVVAGNIRTGVPGKESTQSRFFSGRNRPTQSGMAKPPTPKQAIAEGNEAAAEKIANSTPLTETDLKMLDRRQDFDLFVAAQTMRRGLERTIAELENKMAFSAQSGNKNEQSVRLLEERKVELQGLNRLLAAAKGNEEKMGVLAEEGLETFKAPSKFDAIRTNTPLSAQAVEMAQDGRILDLVNELAKNGSTPAIRATAAKLQPMLMRTKLSVDKDVSYKGESVAGLYDPQDNSIMMHPEGLTEEDVLHEMGHAATDYVLLADPATLTADQRAARKGLEALHARVTENSLFKGEQGISNVREFVAEVTSNNDFRNKLDSVGKPTTLLQQVLGFIKRMLGMQTTMSSKEAQALVDRILAPSRKLAAKAATSKMPSKESDVTAPSLFRKDVAYGQDDDFSEFAKRIVATPKGFKERMGTHLAIESEMQLVDMRAGLRKALEAGAKSLGDTRHFEQAMYAVTKSDQSMPLVLAALSSGPLETYTDAKGFTGIRSSGKNTAKEIFEAVSAIPDSYGNEVAKTNLATAYMIAQRASNKGLSKLDIGALGVTQAEVDAAMRTANADPKLKAALEKARTTYNAYNKGMIEWLASTGAISKKEAAAFLKDEDYVPYYRVRDNGMAELVFGGEKTITIGDVRHQPYLAELKGGETKILPINESIARNTMLLVKKGMTNMAARNIGYAMQAFGQGHGPVSKDGKPTNLMPIHKGQGHADPSVIRWMQEPDPKDDTDKGHRWLRVQTNDTVMGGIPAELIVKSLEGAHLTIPAFLKWGSIAGDLLRTGVTRSPMYLLRQLFRDPFAATFTTGLDYGPIKAIFKANKEFLKISMGQSETGAKLIEKGLIQSGIFTGDPSDLSKFALQLASGQSMGAIDKLFAMTDRAAMNADAATRSLIYDNAIKNGLSEVQADMAVMESMNFHKRGLSPMVQYASRLIPFFNAQIQGLNVLYKAARGQMPYNEQLQIKKKFMNNAMLLMGTGIVYAMLMDDDEYYKNAKPRDRYSNFFVHIPGLDEPLKLPIPYEAGWFFSIAVATVDAMKGTVDNRQQLLALKDMFVGAIPGASSMLAPQLIKPVAEVWTNKNFFNGSSIESARQQKMLPEDRYNAHTTEMAKAMSKMLPLLSPIQIEHLVSGYLGQLPLAALAATDGLFTKDQNVTDPTRHLSQLPVVGSSFQRKYGGEEADVVYRLANEALQVKASFNEYKRTGQVDKAKEVLREHRAELAVAPMAMQYERMMGKFRVMEETIRASKATGDVKQAKIDQLNTQRQLQSERYMQAIKRVEAQVEKTTRP